MSDSGDLRILCYDHIFATGRPPSAAQIADRLAISVDAAKDRLRALNIGKTILLDSDGEIWMAGPFSAKPTGHVVRGSRVEWWANCAWDALAIGILAGAPVSITSDGCGAAPVSLTSRPDQPPNTDLLVHFLLPARQWYDDIGFT